MITKALYEHPDGHLIAFADNRLICASEGDSTAFIPIGPAGLVELGKTLQALGRAELARQTRQTRRAIHPAVKAHRAEVAALKKAAIQPFKDAAKAARCAELAQAKKADRERSKGIA